MSRRRIGVIVGATALTAVAVAASLALIDAVTPRERIVNGLRIWRCDAVGGSVPVEADEVLQLRDGLQIKRYGRAGGVAVVRIKDTSNGESREAAFILTNGNDPREGALDAAARKVAGVHSPERAEEHVAAIAAARECLHRRIPRSNGSDPD